MTDTVLGKRQRKLSPSKLRDGASISNAPVGDTGLTLDGLPTTDEQGNPLSKSAIKRLRKERYWEETKGERREKKREANKRKKQAKKEASGTVLNVNPTPPKPKQQLHEMNVVVDVSFDDKMIDKEVVSLASQLFRTYHVNKASEHTFPVKITSFGGKLKTRMEGPMHGHHLQWKGNITFDEKDYLDLYDKEKLVYLTADSEDTIENLDEGMCYVIGGIVDKNRYKCLCLNKAKEQGIKTAKLPIGEYIKMSSRKILTVNQVVEILHQQLLHNDWEKAFRAIIPMRKFATEGAKARRARKREEKRAALANGQEAPDESASESESDEWDEKSGNIEDLLEDELKTTPLA